MLTGPFCSLEDYLDAVSGRALREAVVGAGRRIAPHFKYEHMTEGFLRDECVSRGLAGDQDLDRLLWELSSSGAAAPHGSRIKEELDRTKGALHGQRHHALVEALRDHDGYAAGMASGLSSVPLIVPALVRIARAIPFGLLYLAHTRFVPFAPVATAEFGLLPLWHRVAYSWLSVRSFGYRFLFAWLLAEAACVASGVALSNLRHVTRKKGILDEKKKINHLFFFLTQINEFTCPRGGCVCGRVWADAERVSGRG